MLDKLLVILKGSRKSLTMWFNTVVGLITSVMVFLPDVIQTVTDNLPQLQPYLGPEAYKKLVFFLLVGNMVLRIKTKGSLADKVEPK